MSKLSKLYEAQQTLKENGLSFSEEQEAQLRALEEEIIKKDILPVLTEQIEPALSQVQRELVLVVDYVPGEDLKVHLSRKRNLADALTDAVEISPKRTVVRTKPVELRSTSVGFTVTFADGTVITHKNAKQTFIEALQHMSLPRVSGFTGRTFADFPLVGKRHRITEDGYKWQEEVDGWWIYINMSNDTKMSILQQVAKYLNIQLTIEVNGQQLTEPQPTKERSRRAMFSLNGGTPACKNRSVLNAVREYFNSVMYPCFRAFEEAFPKELQGSYGVIAKLEDVERRKLKNKTEENRWFLSPEDILTSADGVKFVVSTEWGDNFSNFQSHVNKEFGWTLEEV